MNILDMLKRIVDDTAMPINGALEKPAPVIDMPARQGATPYPNAVMDPQKDFDPSGGTADIGKLLQTGIGRSTGDMGRNVREAKEFAAMVPDLTGTTDMPAPGVNPLMLNPSKPELGPLIKPRDVTPSPFPTPVVPTFDKQDNTEMVEEKPEAKKATGVKKLVSEVKSEEKPEVKTEEAVPKKLTIEDILNGIKKPDDTDKELEDAQEERRNNRMFMALAKGAEQIGAGIGGTKSDKEYINNLQPMVEAPVVDLKEKRTAKREKQKDFMDESKFALDQERGKQDFAMGEINIQKAQDQMQDSKALKDPNSEISKAQRMMYRKLAMDMKNPQLAQGITDSVSADQLAKAFGGININNLWTSFAQQQTAKENAAMRATMADAARSARDKRQESMDISKADRILTSGPINKEMNKLNAARGARAIIDKINSGELKDSKNISNQLTNMISTIEMGGPGAVADRKAMGVDTLYTSAMSTLGWLQSNPNSVIPRKYLKQLETEVDALGNRAAFNYKNMIDSQIAGSDLSLGDPDADPGRIKKLAEQRRDAFLTSSGFDPKTGLPVSQSKEKKPVDMVKEISAMSDEDIEKELLMRGIDPSGL
jgi:hypothetical protein